MVSSDLDLFMTPPTFGGVENVEWIDYRPVNAVGLTGTIDFRIPASGMHYIDMKRSLLYWKGQAVDETGADTDAAKIAAQKIAPINNILHSVFSQVDVTLNQKLISSHNTDYHYKAEMESLLMYDASAQRSQMQSAGFYEDEPSQTIDPLTDPLVIKTEPAGAATEFRYKVANPLYNAGLAQRYTNYLLNADFIGPLFADLFEQDRLLINGVELGVKLYRSDPKFYIKGGKAYQIKFTDIVLKVCKVKLSPQLLLSHEKMLETVPAKYPYSRSELKRILMPVNSPTFRVDNLFQNRVPSKLIVTGVDTSASNGSLTSNPYRFNIDNMTATLKVDGVNVPFQNPLTAGGTRLPGGGTTKDATAYFSCFQGLGRDNTDFGTSRDRVDQNGFFCFDLNGVGESLDAFPLIKRGEVSLEFTFEGNHSKSMLALAYFPDMYQIDKARNVMI